ncbi:MAG: endolytic transglycosylase MltG, partial [Candidatus Saccharimonadales bacterium]
SSTGARRVRRLPSRIIKLLAGLVVVIIIGTFAVHNRYNQALKPVSADQSTQIFTVDQGASVDNIATNLEKAKLIRSAWALKLYVHSKELGMSLQAGTYALSPSQGTVKIVSLLTQGKVSTRLVTILPGQRIDQIRADLINSGFTPSDVDSALDPAQYADLPVLSFKPADVNTLEGLLWPDSFQRDANTVASTIIRESLKAMGGHLGSDVQTAFAAENLTTYQGLTLTSIILREDGNADDQPQVAQVFLSRLKQSMVLGSDVTAIYGSQQAGKGNSLTYDTPYNTHLHTGLPPTPISTINLPSLRAATHPSTTTDWLFFVAGDDGTTYFAKTLAEHEANTAKYCHKLCGQ